MKASEIRKALTRDPKYVEWLMKREHEQRLAARKKNLAKYTKLLKKIPLDGDTHWCGGRIKRLSSGECHCEKCGRISYRRSVNAERS